MRTVPMMRVEVAGAVTTRPGVLDVLQCDSNGKPTVSRMRPQLEPGEMLVERIGGIPSIVRSRTPDNGLIYRDQMMRAVLGTSPVILAREADVTTLDRFARRLAEAEEAMQLLRANGCGTRAQSLPDMVRALLNTTGKRTA